MVFVKVRETYDLKTIRNKMSIIAIHTPDSNIIKRDWPGLLMNCKFYKPVKCDVVVACASTLPLDPQGVGTTEGDVAPEDMFNPILYKACTNESFSLLESRILAETYDIAGTEIQGQMARVDADNVTPYADEFPCYYGLLQDAHGWRHAMPQDGLLMKGLRPYVHEVLASFGTSNAPSPGSTSPADGIRAPINNGETSDDSAVVSPRFMRGNAKPMPRIPTTAFAPQAVTVTPGFSVDVGNAEQVVPGMRTLVGCIIMPPSRLHELFYRMTVVWTLEFSEIRPLSQIGKFDSLQRFGNDTHFQSYNFADSKTLTNEEALASSNVDMNKVM